MPPTDSSLLNEIRDYLQVVAVNNSLEDRDILWKIFYSKMYNRNYTYYYNRWSEKRRARKILRALCLDNNVIFEQIRTGETSK